MKITNTNNKPMKKPQKFDTQFFVDTAEYNYNLGYLKAIEEVEKIIEDFIHIKKVDLMNDGLRINHLTFEIFTEKDIDFLSKEINKLKEDLKKDEIRR